MRDIKKGAASQSVYFEFLDTASGTGGRKTGVAYNTAGLTAYYVRNQAAAVAIALVTQTAAGAWSSGGFAEVDAVNMPGVYRLDVPNAAFAAGADSVVITVKGATGMAQVSLEIGLVDNVVADIYARLGAPVGASVSADVAAVKAVLPAALVGGRIDANIGSVGAAAITAAAFAANALDAVWSAATRVLTAGTNIVLAKDTGVTGFNDLTAGAVANAVWDATTAAHVTPLSTGAALNAAGSSGDPWSTALPGGYGAGTAGNILGTKLDAAISSRLASGAYSAPDNAGVAAIKAKTDNLPAAPADETLIIAATTALGNSIAALPTANANADALLDRAAGVETGWTLRQAMRIMLSVLAGKASGLDTNTAVYRDMADTKNRISATVDDDGNRTTVTRDAS